MTEFVIEIAGEVFAVRALFESTRDYCGDYRTDMKPEFFVAVTQEDLSEEQRLLDVEADEEGLKRRRFGGPFLERSVIQRRVAEALLARETIMMHGSTVAVDGKAFLFTAACGTGKSTHTRLWREVFGARAVMVNDDKPFLRVEWERVLAFGSPWTGKHGLGENVCVPLKGICILKRGSENRIRRVDALAQLEMLKHQAFDADALVERLARMVPVWEMECTKDPEAAVVSYEAMSK